MISALRKAQVGTDFTPLKGAFIRPTILPIDVDGMVEVNGHFLFIERKLKNETLSKGQEIALRRLASINQITVLLVQMSGRIASQGAYLCDPVRVCIVKPKGSWDWQDTNIENFRLRCLKWSEEATKNNV